MDNQTATQIESKPGIMLAGEFPLSQSPTAYVINLHMRNIIECYEVVEKRRIPKSIYERHFDNWVGTFGLATVEEALNLMGRGLDGRKFKKEKAA